MHCAYHKMTVGMQISNHSYVTVTHHKSETLSTKNINRLIQNNLHTYFDKIQYEIKKYFFLKNNSGAGGKSGFKVTMALSNIIYTSNFSSLY